MPLLDDVSDLLSRIAPDALTPQPPEEEMAARPKPRNVMVGADTAQTPSAHSESPEASLAQKNGYLPPPILPKQVAPDLMKEALDRAARYGFVRQAVGTHLPNWYEVKQGKGVTPLPTPALDAAEHAGNADLIQARGDVAHQNAVADLLNKYNATVGKMKFDSDKGQLAAMVKMLLAAKAGGLKERQIGETERHNKADEQIKRLAPPKLDPETKRSEGNADKEFERFIKQTDEYNGRASSLRILRDQLVAGKKLVAVIRDANGNIQNLNTNQMTEVGRLLDRMLSQGGQVSEGITRELTPHTSGRKLSEIAQWITNIPVGTNQQAFLKQVLDTVNRENGVAEETIRGAKTAALSGIPNALKSRRNDVVTRLRGIGLNPDGFDLETGLPLPSKIIGDKTYVKRADGWYPLEEK